MEESGKGKATAVAAEGKDLSLLCLPPIFSLGHPLNGQSSLGTGADDG